MSSGLERRAGRGLVVRLTLVNAVFLAVAGFALWCAAFQVVRWSLSEDWSMKRERVHQSLTLESGHASARRFTSEDFVLLSLPPSAQRRLEQHVIELLPALLGLLFGTSLIAGWWMAHRSLRPLRSLAARAHACARGDAPDQRLLPHYRSRGDLADLAGLLDDLLDRNRKLVQAMHESLDNIGHDLRTPMARMRATAEQVVDGADPGAMREALSTCIEESDQVLRLLATLVDLSRAESGTLALERTDTDVGALLEDVRDLYEMVAEDRRVHLRVDAAEELLAFVDRTRTREAIANCVDNAIKYGAADDTVHLRARPTGSGGVRIEIEDHGAGIPPEDLPMIWERLFRGDRARSSGGLGLGLSVVKAIVDAHGGSVGAVSEPGRTVIALEFPRRPSGSSASAVDDAARHGAGPHRDPRS